MFFPVVAERTLGKAHFLEIWLFIEIGHVNEIEGRMARSESLTSLRQEKSEALKKLKNVRQIFVNGLNLVVSLFSTCIFFEI